MSRVCIVINDPNATIVQLVDKLQVSTADKNTLINLVADYLTSAAMGNVSAGSVQVTVRDSDPSISTSGTGSAQSSVNVG